MGIDVLILAFKMLRPYFMYQKLILYTDHVAVNCLLTINESSGHQTRWRLCLAEFDFDINYKTTRRVRKHMLQHV